jgi:transcriptional regulator with XRE-family HTH domain
MTAAELVQYNLTRLVEASGRDPVDIAIVAWPMPDFGPAPVRRWSEHKKARAKRLARYMSGKHTPPKAALDDLARALEVPVSAFFRLPN